MSKKTLKEMVRQEMKLLLEEQPKEPTEEKSDPQDVEKYKIAKTKGMMPAASKKINTRPEAVAVAMDDIKGDIKNLPSSTKKQVITALVQKLKKQLSGQ